MPSPYTYLVSYLEHAVQTHLHDDTNLEIKKFLQLFSEIMTDNTSNQSWVKFDQTDGSISNNVTRSQPMNIDPIRINEDKYTGKAVNGVICMLYSQVPIKQVGPNKRVGWIFYVNFLNKKA
jgi:hypothetical protein